MDAPNTIRPASLVPHPERAARIRSIHPFIRQSIHPKIHPHADAVTLALPSQCFGSKFYIDLKESD